jgi:hypothetical protein
VKSPPDSFILEEALQNAKYKGHNVASNAEAVGQYMNQLQDYLEVYLFSLLFLLAKE